MIRVGVVGYGTIGSRVADAVARQRDMELVGVAKTRPDYRALIAVRKGYKLFVPRERVGEFEALGIRVEGTIEELVDSCDVVVDATPGGVGAKNKEVLYSNRNVKVVFQGGEKASVAEVSFNALANYEEAVGKRFVRVVSCNTTAILRILAALELGGLGVAKARIFIARRGADPHEHRRGPINDVVLDPAKIPSHHAEDVLTVMKSIDIVTAAVAIPVTLAHLHFLYIELKREASKDLVVEVLRRTPRILLFESRLGFASVSHVIEWARYLGRERNDVPENVVFLDTVTVRGRELYMVMAVHQESIVVPENIDAIRAVSGFEDRWRSIQETDRSLGLVVEGKVYGGT